MKHKKPIKVLLTKINIIFRQNLSAFLIVFIWFLGNYFYFLFETSFNYLQSIHILLFFMNSDTLWGTFYANFSEFIIFGTIFSLITIDLFRKYNPVEACRKFASILNDHIIIIGYNNIGRRLADYLRSCEKDFIVIDKDPNAVADIIDAEEPVIVDDGLSLKALLDAGVKNASGVFIMSDHLELLMVACANVRRYNKKCQLVCRVFEDDIAEVIANTYDATTISTSKFASDVIINEIRSIKPQNILLIGMNHINIRLIRKLKSKFPKIRYSLIEENEELVEDLLEEREMNIIIGDPKEYITLNKIPIGQVNLVINTLPDTAKSILITKRIRDLNRNCKIIARLFHEEIAEVIMDPPFNAEVISSSKFTLEIMKKNRLLNV
ncbi:MAG: hypothetical protein BAJALOKI1v1_2080005 [Promethearchaeota archaeon]|nr:MAG: hypothetical protein BAJALOKI1v1_2080005 [Candidatus Lokiarchaeota archaeon]